MPYLIDGHNVIAALPDIVLEDPDDEAKLVLRLRAWAARIHRHAIVVFDGGIPGGPSRTLSTPDVKVIFAARHHTNADRIIRERVRSLPDASNWTVVTSDREIRDEAENAGARVMTAQEFADRVDRPPIEKEKPETVTPAEVEAWLEIFQEPEEKTPSPTRADGKQTAEPPDLKAPPRKKRRRGRRPHRHSNEPVGHTRSIGDQLGIDVEPAPEPEERPGKPSGVTRQEVRDWLEVFHDDPESHVPPPNVPKRPKKRPPKHKPPVVNKQGELSPDEVDTWLELFEEGGRSEETIPRPKAKPRDVSEKLRKHQANVAPAEEEKDPDLSDEDLELWHRLFGEETS